MALYPGCWSIIALLLCTAPLLAAAQSFTCASYNDPVTCSALGDLYGGTSGTSWNNNVGWSSAASGTATDYCTFYGAVCTSGTLTSMYVHRLVISSKAWLGYSLRCLLGSSHASHACMHAGYFPTTSLAGQSQQVWAA